jgi:HSP20 family molecular chaperone IbpA
MVRNALFRGLFDDPLFHTCFFGKQTEPKPPSEIFPVYDKENVFKGWKIIYALAGFREEDLEVYTEGEALFIKGDNRGENSPLFDGTYLSKFACAFEHRYATTEIMDLQNITTVHANGLLQVFIPVKEVEKPKRNILLGKRN